MSINEIFALLDKSPANLVLAVLVAILLGKSGMLKFGQPPPPPPPPPPPDPFRETVLARIAVLEAHIQELLRRTDK